MSYIIHSTTKDAFLIGEDENGSSQVEVTTDHTKALIVKDAFEAEMYAGSLNTFKTGYEFEVSTLP